MLAMHIFMGLDSIKNALQIWKVGRETQYLIICLALLGVPLLTGFLVEKLNFIIPSCIFKVWVTGYLLLTVPYPLICCLALHLSPTHSLFLAISSLILTMKLVSFHHV